MVRRESLTKTCNIPDCGRGHYGKGWCEKHYLRWRAHGDPLVVLTSSPKHTLSERFLFRGWDVVGGPLDTPCWHWRGKPAHFGYGVIRFQGKNFKAHRVSYEYHVGPIPDELVIRHKCDVSICINPDHLETGTHWDNMRDRDLRGRSGSAKITWDDVRYIRATEESPRELSEKFGISPAAISRVRSNETWVDPDYVPR